MNIYQFIKIVLKHIQYIIILPIITGAIVYALTGDLPVEYHTQATLFTGITSNTGIGDLGGGRVDYFATQNAYNNIITILQSKSVLEETSLRLLALHLMLEKADKNKISPRSFEELMNSAPQEVKNLVVKDDPEKSYVNIKNYVTQDKNNWVYELLHFEHPHYSLKALENLKAVRVSSSDLVQVSYSNNDPGVCFQTVKILTNVFIEMYNSLKQNQTSSAVAYFEEQLRLSAEKLRESEDLLLEFNTSNKVINYYEQTKHVSSQEEKIEVKLQELKMEYEAGQAVLIKIENETQKRYHINLRNEDVMRLREELMILNDKLAQHGFYDRETENEETQKLEKRKIAIEDELKNKMDSLYHYDSHSQGIGIEKMLEQWLNAVIDYESAKARYMAMITRREEFRLLYSQFAPLGAQLKRIEREIDIHEEEYLNILHHLGLARLKQQNADLLSDMKLMDPPPYPINAEDSKQSMYIIVAGMFSAIFYILALFLLELFDQRIKTPARLKEFSDIEVIGAFCKTEFQEKDSEHELFRRTIRYIVEKIGLNEKTGDKEPMVIQLISIWRDEGKANISTVLGKYLESLGRKVKIIEYSGLERETYAKGNEDAEYIIVYVPAISGGVDNPALLKTANINLLIARAIRTWSESDSHYLKKIKEMCPAPIYSVLTDAMPDNLEELFGEIPKKRSWLRTFIKHKLLKRFI